MTDVLQRGLSLARIVADLRLRQRQFALVGGLAVSARAEPRFTRDVDIATVVTDDLDAESLVRELAGYRALATVEHEQRGRLSTVRLRSPEGAVVDLLFASCGIEAEIVDRATPLDLPDAAAVPTARSEELLAMKVLSMSQARLHDRIDACGLVTLGVDLDRVRANPALITERGYHRAENLETKLAEHATHHT